jgi:hypothetical protein
MDCSWYLTLYHFKRTYIRFLGDETMDLFMTFSRDAPDVFCTDMLGDRIAAMLNYNIIQVILVYLIF